VSAAGDLGEPIRRLAHVDVLAAHDRHGAVAQVAGQHVDVAGEAVGRLADRLQAAPTLAVQAAWLAVEVAGSRYLIMTWDNSMQPCTDLPYVEKALLRRANTGRDLEIRLVRC
jgi:hypothetical protein